MESFDQLKKVVSDVEDDLSKAVGGNRAAGTRVRQSMQQIKKLAQSVCAELLAVRNKKE